MIEIEYPPEPEEGQTRVEWERTHLNPWRQLMKGKLLARHGPMCARGCGRFGIDYDEPLLPRCDMGGLSLEKRRLAFASCNGELCCAPCNRESAHDRDAAWERACERYGEGAVRAWYAGIGLRAPRADWLPR